jgi:hypothetical protein
MIRVSSLLFFFNMAVGLIAGTDNQGKAIDTQCSSLTIHVGKAGIFPAVAHEHWLNAPIASGTVNDTSAAPAVRFAIDARKLSVLVEKGLSDKDQAEVQSNMHSKVLESSAYPEILFPIDPCRADQRPRLESDWRINLAWGDQTRDC